MKSIAFYAPPPKKKSWHINSFLGSVTNIRLSISLSVFLSLSMRKAMFGPSSWMKAIPKKNYVQMINETFSQKFQHCSISKFYWINDITPQIVPLAAHLDLIFYRRKERFFLQISKNLSNLSSSIHIYLVKKKCQHNVLLISCIHNNHKYVIEWNFWLNQKSKPNSWLIDISMIFNLVCRKIVLDLFPEKDSLISVRLELVKLERFHLPWIFSIR